MTGLRLLSTRKLGLPFPKAASWCSVPQACHYLHTTTVHPASKTSLVAAHHRAVPASVTFSYRPHTQRSQNTASLASAHRATSTTSSHPVSGSEIAPHAGSEITHHAVVDDDDHHLRPAVYQPPKTGLVSRLPASWVPYAELIRLDRPTGTLYLFFPCFFSTLLAAPLAGASPTSVLGTSALFLTGALIMRGAGCTINDFFDRKLDPHVSRTRFRPLARGAIAPAQAVVFTGAQLLAGLALLLQLPTPCLYYGVPSLLFVTAYPLMKRITYYPQIVLGFTFSWGAIMGFPALGIDLLSPAATPALTAATCLYASNIAWTVLYDMIYAHMDLRDDAKAGIKSIVVKHAHITKPVMSGLAAVQVGLLAAAGAATGAGPAFFVGSCGGALTALAVMIKRVNLTDVKDCWWWFVHGCWITGGTISFGLGLDYLLRTVDDAEEA